jgi:deoxyribose-phosphate aldolase
MSYEEIAGMIDHSLLHPMLTDDEIRKGCMLAVNYRVASVCVKPYAVKQAGEILKGSEVKNGTVIGFPHGNSSIEVKAYETDRVIADGAVEIDMVVNIGKVLGAEYLYVEKEIGTILEITRKNKAVLKVIFENDYLPEDRFKIELCRICSALKVDFVKTSTGYGFRKFPDGSYNYSGATDHDLILMRQHCPSEIQVKAAGAVRTLDDLLRVKSLGVSRVGASATREILEELKKRIKDKELR